MVNAEYLVRLEAFEGPLDLLLFLIRRAEVEITDIPIAAITEQYLTFLTEFTDQRRLDIEQAGEFLVMAATLMEIKSRMLGGKKLDAGEADGSGREDEAAVDPRSELVRQLLEYKRYRDATDRLEEWRSEWEHRYPAARVVIGKPSAEELAAETASAEEERIDVDNLQLIDLVEAFARVVESVDFSRVGEHRVTVDETPVEVHGERIVVKLRASANGSVEFRSLFVDKNRAEMIGVFLAILELVKQQKLKVEQEEGEIVLRMGDEQPPVPPTSPDVVVVSEATATASS